VQRILSIALCFCLLTLSSGCGAVFIGGAIQTSTVSGTISLVRITAVVDGGANVTVTFVTFLQVGDATTIGFCGDHRTQFPVNQFVRANFTPGQPCSSIIVIFIT
jgi:hypothetical protein